MKLAVILNFECLAILLASLSSTAQLEGRPAHSLASQREARTSRRSVINYFYLLPSLGMGTPATSRRRGELLRTQNQPIIDVRHDYLLVRPDSSPAEQIAVFRSRGGSDLIADSLPDSVSDYNGFALYRLRHGRLRDVTRQMLPMPPDLDHLLYELPRFGSTIRVFRFDLDTETRRHVFDLFWFRGSFLKVDDSVAQGRRGRSRYLTRGES